MSATINAILARLGRLESSSGLNPSEAETVPGPIDFYDSSTDNDERLVWITPTSIASLSAAVGWTTVSLAAYVPENATRVLLDVRYRVDGDDGVADMELETRPNSGAAYNQRAVKFWWGPRDTNGTSAQVSVQIAAQSIDYRLVHTVASGLGSWVTLDVDVEILGYWTA